MAIDNKLYQRPDSAATKYAADKILLDAKFPTASDVVEDTTTTLAAVLPASQAFVSADREAANVICGGTPHKIGNIYGILLKDTKESSEASFLIRGRVYLKLTAAITPVQGQAAYIVDATGLAHDTAGAGLTKVGIFAKAGVTTNPPYLPAGDYATVDLYPNV